MFTGIIEDLAKVENIEREGSNIHFDFSCAFTNELKIDQSVAHNGVCLTVVDIQKDHYRVTAIDETLKRTNLGELKIGDIVNLERCVKVGDRLDGHMVQGHVDTTAKCSEVKEIDGSWEFKFSYQAGPGYITVQKGSICINGVSLTVVESGKDYFSVCIIPYTYEHTNFKNIQQGTTVNLEFDILGKYISKLMANQA